MEDNITGTEARQGTESDTPHRPAVTANADAFSPPQTPDANTPPARLRLEFLDGLRGLAALYVVLFHAGLQQPQYVPQLSPPARMCLALTQYGHYAVDVFIVLSGYCLMLPVARSKNGQLRGGVREYLKRRALRILPTYYVALFLSIIILALPALTSFAVRFLEHRPVVGVISYMNWNATWAREVGEHILMIHNWFPQKVEINGPMWSVALEWQIYFLLPLLLLPLWHRFGIVACIVIASVLGVLPHLLLPASYNFDWTSPWMLGLFTLGMGGAVLTAAMEKKRLTGVPDNQNWGIISGLLAAVFVGFCALRPDLITNSLHPVPFVAVWAMDFLVGLVTVGVILYCVQSVYAVISSEAGVRIRHRPVLRLLEAKWALSIGTFSYSLYLIHGPILFAIKSIISNNLHLLGTRAIGAEYTIGVILSVSAAYVLYIAVERRFLPGRPRTERQTIAATVREPAI